MVSLTERRFPVIDKYVSPLQRTENSLLERFPWHPKPMHVVPMFPVSPPESMFIIFKTKNLKTAAPILPASPVENTMKPLADHNILSNTFKTYCQSQI